MSATTIQPQTWVNDMPAWAIAQLLLGKGVAEGDTLTLTRPEQDLHLAHVFSISAPPKPKKTRRTVR
jgi:hypothetical protein